MVKLMASDWFTAIINWSSVANSKKESPAVMESFLIQIFQMLTMHMRAVIARLSQCLLFTIALLHLVMAIFTTALRHAEILKLQGWNSMIMHILYTMVT